ncbi:MAG: nitronate monooxygenase [Pseudomonadota bacterium]
MLKTRLTTRFNLRHPIVSAPMALAAGGALAGAVSAAGGLGLIAGGYADKAQDDWLDDQFLAAGNQKVGCGFITWSLGNNPDALTRALAHRPAALFLSFGDALPYREAIEAADVPLFMQVQSIADARAALACGACAIVAQGAEAGGHGDKRATMTLVPEVVDLVAQHAPETLVLAAGGIADGRGIAAALALGADGVVIGSRFWASEEALVHPAQRARAVAATGDETVRTTVFDKVRRRAWPERFTIRVMRNAYLEGWQGREAALDDAIEEEAARFAQAWGDGDTTVASAVVGEATGLIDAVEPAGVILARISAEAEAEIARLHTLRA